MKKNIGIMVLLIAIGITNVFSQGKIRVFNTVLKVKDIIGTTNLSTQKWHKDLKEVLVKNEDYYLKTIGSYRNDWNSTDPNSLFNLIDKGSYPLLDEINMRFYDEVVIQELKSDMDIRKREDFIKFCNDWNKLTGFAERKALFFRNEYIEIGKTIQKGRFSITNAQFILKKEVMKKLSATITGQIKDELKANSIEASVSLVNYLSRVVNSQTSYSGQMIIVEFRDEYMTRLKNALAGISKDKIGQDDFSVGLLDYATPGSGRTATTGLVVFKIEGKINKSAITEDSLKADIKAKFTSLDEKKVADIAVAISVGFVSKVSRTFSAEIDNVYIKTLLTSQKIDDIEISIRSLTQ